MNQATESSLSESPPSENTLNQSPLNVFKTQLDAVQFLASQGYKLGKSTFNNHIHEGLVCTNEDGYFHKATLLGYALNNLKSTIIAGDMRSMEAQINRVASDADLKQVKTERERIKLLREQNALMPVADHERDLAARALFFKQEIQSFIHRKADDMIILVGGNENFHAKFVHWWEQETADWMDAWSTDRDFSVADADADAEESLFDNNEMQED